MNHDEGKPSLPNMAGDRSQPSLRRFLRSVDVTDYDALLERADADPRWFWQALVTHFDPVFEKAPDAMDDTSSSRDHHRWLPGARLNIADTCLRTDLDGYEADRPALVWEGESGQTITRTRGALAQEVRRAAQGLHDRGIKKGDRVGIFMPMIPETIAAFLAISSIGAVALPLFSGYGAEAVAQRLGNAEAKALITVDGTRRRGRTVPIKTVADAAVRSLPSIETVIVVEQAGIPPQSRTSRDISWVTLMSGGEKPARPLDAESTLMLVYTSGTSGNPKGTIHAHGGFLLKVLCDLGLLLDMGTGDRVMWMGDFGWLTGPILAVGVLATGGCLVMAEGTPDYPQTDRVFDLLSRHRISVFSLSPTLIRAQIAAGTVPSNDHDLSALRVIASTGEAWSRNAWDWCMRYLGLGGARILNYTGGTEIGGSILSGNLLLPDVPCSVGKPAPAMGAAILREDGSRGAEGQVGELVLDKPSPGLSRGLWQAEDVYQTTYWSRHSGYWSHGDLVFEDDAGFWHMAGRRDEVLKVAGKRIGAVEIENVAAQIDGVSEVAVVSAPDEVKGEVIVIFCVPTANSTTSSEDISKAVTNAFGPAFRPRSVVLVPDLPRTRTNKIMRSVLKTLVRGGTVDMSHIANPDIVEKVRESLSPS